MSKFKTIIPVRVDAVLKLLPEGSGVESVRLDADLSAIEIVWANDHYKTGFTFPIEWQDLATMPGNVRDVRKPAMPAVVSGQAESSLSNPDPKRDDARPVKKKRAS